MCGANLTSELLLDVMSHTLNAGRQAHSRDMFPRRSHNKQFDSPSACEIISIIIFIYFFLFYSTALLVTVAAHKDVSHKSPHCERHGLDIVYGVARRSSDRCTQQCCSTLLSATCDEWFELSKKLSVSIYVQSCPLWTASRATVSAAALDPVCTSAQHQRHCEASAMQLSMEKAEL